MPYVVHFVLDTVFTFLVRCYKSIFSNVLTDFLVLISSKNSISQKLLRIFHCFFVLFYSLTCPLYCCANNPIFTIDYLFMQASQMNSFRKPSFDLKVLLSKKCKNYQIGPMFKHLILNAISLIIQFTVLAVLLVQL